MSWLGDFNVGQKVKCVTETTDGDALASISDLDEEAVRVYRVGDDVGTTAGVTFSPDFYGDGVHDLEINTTADPEYYLPGHNFFAVYTSGTLGGVDITGRVIEEAFFSIRNRSGTASNSDSNGDFSEESMSNVWVGGGIAQAMIKRATVPEDVTDLVAEINGKQLSLGADLAEYPTIWSKAIYPEFADVSCEIEGRDIILTSRFPGQPFDVKFLVFPLVTTKVITPGVLAIKQLHTITIPSTTTGGTWPVEITRNINGTVETDTITGIDYDVDPDDLKDLMEAVSFIGVGNLAVTGSPGSYQIELINDLAGQNLALLVTSGNDLTGNASGGVSTPRQGGAVNYHRMLSVIFANTYVGSGALVLGLRDVYENPVFTTPVITTSKTSDEIKALLEASPDIGVGNVDVVGQITINRSSGVWTTTQISLMITLKNSARNLPYPIFIQHSDGASSWTGTAPNLTFVGYNRGLLTERIISASAGHEVQIVDMTDHAYHGSSTSCVYGYNGSNATAGHYNLLKTKIEGLSGVGTVTVYTGPVFGGYYEDDYGTQPTVSASDNADFMAVVFSDTTDKFTITATSTDFTPVITVIQEGGPINERHAVWTNGTGGNLTLTYGGDTATIPAGSAAATVQTLYTALPSVGSGNAVVSGLGTLASPYLIDYQGALAATNLTEPILDVSGLTGGKPIATAIPRPGVPGVNQVERLTIKSNVNSGAFEYRYGAPKISLDWDFTLPDLQTGINALRGDGNSTVTGAAGTYTITASGSLAQRPLTALSIGTSTLSASSTITIDTVQESRGPCHGNDPYNWSLRRPPGTGDVVVMDTSDNGWLYDIQLRSNFTRSGNNLVGVRASFVIGQCVRVKTTGTLPGGLEAGTDYYIRYIDPDSDIVQLASDADLSTQVTMSSDGTGTHEISVVLAGLKVLARHTNGSGLPRENGNGDYPEYRPTYLAVDFFDDVVIPVGQGEGGGLSLFRLDAGKSRIIVKVYKTGSAAEDDLPAMLLLNINSQSKLTGLGGSVGIAMLPDEESELGLLDIRGADVKTGELFKCTEIDVTSGTYRSLKTSIVSGSISMTG